MLSPISLFRMSDVARVYSRSQSTYLNIMFLLTALDHSLWFKEPLFMTKVANNHMQRTHSML